ncbi:hypothetical protein GGTG_04958 [Gaeumannomyces tritici R3-111a-1]|uniref:Uncharacterized protein n=1 Tax=Gaeumannomyces tritici (strain R3-111a-1) TaxID=644352 RepID=J3NUK2_GAET3|nr:hypothetical protein GGTG_04958 [Gaeumannomyces tritici R3-111a-1]EJT79875.1 hypothetical protein GGTG_04958 [Gaeumannomyces tritici R3-111a-1]
MTGLKHRRDKLAGSYGEVRNAGYDDGKLERKIMRDRRRESGSRVASTWTVRCAVRPLLVLGLVFHAAAWSLVSQNSHVAARYTLCGLRPAPLPGATARECGSPTWSDVRPSVPGLVLVGLVSAGGREDQLAMFHGGEGERVTSSGWWIVGTKAGRFTCQPPSASPTHATTGSRAMCRDNCPAAAPDRDSRCLSVWRELCRGDLAVAAAVVVAVVADRGCLSQPVLVVVVTV